MCHNVRQWGRKVKWRGAGVGWWGSVQLCNADMLATWQSLQARSTALNVRECFRHIRHWTLRQFLVQLRDHTPTEKRTGVVYEIPCGTCSKAYIGQTGWTLDQQMKEHKEALTSGNAAICSSRACHGQDACVQLGRGAGCRQSSTLHPAVHTGGVAHLVRDKQPKQRCRPTTIHLTL